MLFRKTTRKRFIFLVAAFLFMMGFNTYSYVTRYHKTEIQKQELLDEKAFKVFFLRSSTRGDCERFLARHTAKIQNYGSEIVHDAFIYQNNLYIHFNPGADDGSMETESALDLLYGLFNIKEASRDFFRNDSDKGYYTAIRDTYFDYNGTWLSDDILRVRHKGLKQDLTDISDMIREGSRGKRRDAFNSVRNTIIDNIKRTILNKDHEPNPYLSRIESIIPMNFLYIMTNVRLDTTTDVFDLAESVRTGDEGFIESPRTYLSIPSIYRGKPLYLDLDIYPRYIPLYVPDIIKQKWNVLLSQDLDVKWDFMDYIDQLHFKGHYMFSYEKSHIIKDKVKRINDDIRTNNIHFYLTDLSMGIAFPFMISLFAFIHLKTEIAYLFMFKNMIRELLFIFWLLPVFLMLFVKTGVIIFFLLSLLWKGSFFSPTILIPLSITFIFASLIFYPVNRWCFSQFTGEKLNLYALHKGR